MNATQNIGVAAVIFISILLVSPFRSDSNNMIRPLEIVQLNQMVKNANDRCLITVMAAWCAPCIKELPDLNKLYIKYKDQGLRVIGITVDLDGR